MKPVDLAGDVVSGASALAGLFLVYLGSAASSFAAYDKIQQDSVKDIYRKRGWLALAGIVLAILAAGLALLGKWLGSQPVVSAAIVLLMLSLIWGAALAVMAVRDIQ